METIKKLKHVVNMRLKEDLISFLKRGFEELNPTSIYIHNWHIDEICENLVEVYLTNKKRLIINMPPRYLKSMSISVCFTAWILGLNPSKRIIVASYSQSLATKHSLDTKKIIQSHWYKELFPDTQIVRGQNEKNKFVTTKGGFRFATSSGGTLTGEGGDILIVDDPHKPSTINSKKQREKVLDWFENTFISRLDNKKTGGIIIVMQRLHEEDLVGTILKRDASKWSLLNLKAISEEEERHRKYGFPLHEKRENLHDLLMLKKEMGEREFNAQYQQNPNSLMYSIFKRKWFKTIGKYKILPTDIIVISVDSASKTFSYSDFTALSVWCIKGEEDIILIDLIRDKVEFGDLLLLVKKAISKYKPKFVIIEDKSSGIALAQELKRDISEVEIVAFKVKYEKIVRFLSIITYFERGFIKINKNLHLLEEFQNEIMMFPNAKYDDMVDSIVNFLTWHSVSFKKVNNVKASLSLRFI
jgi:predicted phage terminase large subunit-like protein